MSGTLNLFIKYIEKEKEKMKTRIISMILVVVMLALTLVGCGYDFTKKDMSENAEFADGVNAEGFKALLQALSVEAPDFGDVSKTEKRADKVNDKIYELLIKEVETTTSTSGIPKEQIKEGILDENDWLFYSYYATYVKTEEGKEPETVVIYPSKMSGTLTSVKLGYSNETLTGIDKNVRDAVLAMLDKGPVEFADIAYKTTSDNTLGIYEYVDKDDKDGNNNKQVYVYVSYKVVENNKTNEYKNVRMLLDLSKDAAERTFLENLLLSTETKDENVVSKYYIGKTIAEKEADAIVDQMGTLVPEKPADIAEDADQATKDKYAQDMEAYKTAKETAEADDVKYYGITVNFAVESDINNFIEVDYKFDKDTEKVIDVELGDKISLPKDTEIKYYVYPVYYADVEDLEAEVVIKTLISSISEDSLDCFENAEAEVKAFADALTAFTKAEDTLETKEDTYENKIKTYEDNLKTAIKTLKEKDGADATAIDAFAALIQTDDVKNSNDPIAKIGEVLNAAKTAETDETKKQAIEDFKTAITGDTLVKDASDAVKTAKTELDTAKKTLEGDPAGADDKAKDGAKKTYEKARDALYAKVGDDANADTTDDSIKGMDKIVASYEKSIYDELAEEYEDELETHIGKAVWKLMKEKVNVTEAPEKAVKDIYNRMYEEYEYKFYTGYYQEKSSNPTNYKWYSDKGGFKQYLIENTVGNGKGDFKDAKEHLMKEAEDYVKEIVVIYFVADALGLKLDKDEVKEFKKSAEFETYAEGYGEINVMAARQAEKLFDYILEVETEKVTEDGEEIEKPVLDEETGARKYLNIKVTEYTEKTEEEEKED